MTAPTNNLLLTRQLLYLRTLGKATPAKNSPIIHNMPPCPIAFDEPNELLLGLIFPTRGKLEHITQPDSIRSLNEARGSGLVRQVVNFYLTTLDGGTLLTTETRAIANDHAAQRRFGLYWTAIRAGSGLIRHDVLRAFAKVAQT